MQSNDPFSIIKEQVMEEISPYFEKIETNYSYNFRKILQAFQHSKVSSFHFSPTYGYGLFDAGTKAVEKVFASIFKAESALVRPQIVSGTQALFLVLNSLLSGKDTFVSILGAPYETLKGCIGIEGNYPGSLIKKGINYLEINLLEKYHPGEYKKLIQKSKLAWIQKSSGYGNRRSVSNEQIKNLIEEIRIINPEILVAVDNCYGEFVETIEPIEAGADICAGSFLKNPGGGIAKTGGYIAGRKDLVDLCSSNLIAPGLGFETTPNLGFIPQILQGLFHSPMTVRESLKGNLFLACFMEKLGFIVSPRSSEDHFDIVMKVSFPNPELLTLFSKLLQTCSPIDSYVDPVPFQQEGYNSPIIMAGGTFTHGSSIEFTADGFTKEPYNLYYQPGMYAEQTVVLAEKIWGDYQFKSVGERNLKKNS